MNAEDANGDRLPRPFYADEWATIYCGDCRVILPLLGFDVIVTDPPYGVGVKTNYAERGRGSLAQCHDFPPIEGDDEPFDPSFLLGFAKPTVMFGANHFASRLPDSASWFVWDKLDGLKSDRDLGFNDQADAELVWTNLGGPARLLAQRWMGAMKAGREAQSPRLHPTQKPVELMRRIVGACPPGVVADPYMGSGTTLRAAKDIGRRAIGIELSEAYCDIAATRLAQGVLDLGGVA